MSKLNNIDELLKESFQGFAPDAPDVWQGVQAAHVTTNASAAISASKAGLGIAAKITIAIGTVAVIATSAYFIFTDTAKETVVENIPITTAESLQSADEQLFKQENKSAGISNAAKQELTNRNKLSTPKRKKLLLEDIQTTNLNPTSTIDNNDPINIATENEFTTSNTISTPTGSNNSTSNQPISKPQQEVQKANLHSEAKKSVELNEQKIAEKPTIKIENKAPIIPNIFTPNGDGINETLMIEIENEQFFHLLIRDKNAKVVFETFDKNNHWDGINKFTGIACETGIYIYSLIYQYKNDDNQLPKSGILKLQK